MSLLELKLLHAFLKLLMEGDEKRNFFDKITQLSCCLLIDYIDILGQILEGYHDFVQRMRL